MITEMDPGRFTTRSLQDPRLLRILQAALNAVEPSAAVRRALEEKPLPAARHVCALAVGKAALPMLAGLANSAAIDEALAITKHLPQDAQHSFPVLVGGHPVPDERSLEAGGAALEFAGRLTSGDLLVCLISGGGSALMSAPRLPLEELQRLTTALLGAGARIDEINTLRRHLDEVKGGGLARAAGGAQVVSLILSDVVGDTLEAIASGPTAPDPTDLEAARRVIERYGLEGEFAEVIPVLHETFEPGDPVFARVENRIIASVRVAVEAARVQARREGFNAEVLTSSLQGEAREAGRELAERLRVHASMGPRPFCLLAGGETTVTLRATGRGGRNQETALAAVPVIAGLEDVLFLPLATDGEDGPTEAAGAVVTGRTLEQARLLGLDPARALAENDSYSFFAALGDLVRTGPTGTNVNDIILMAGL